MQFQSPHGNAVAGDMQGASALFREVNEFTFLATDIVGSSELHRRYPDGMLQTMDRHDEIVHDVASRT